MALIQMKGVTKKYNRGATALRNITISVNQGEFVYLVGPSGAGKSTFLKILAGDIEPTTGHISLGPDERLSVLRQNHFDYEDERVIDVVIMGNEKLYNIMKEKNAKVWKEIYEDFYKKPLEYTTIKQEKV